MALLCKVAERPEFPSEPAHTPEMSSGWKSITQIHAELKAVRAEPVVNGPLAVDIVRQDRDSR